MKKNNNDKIIDYCSQMEFDSVHNIDLSLYRFMDLRISNSDNDKGIIYLSGPQIEMISIKHYCVGNSLFVIQRMREKEKGRKNNSLEYYNKKPKLSINILLPKKNNTNLNLVLGDGISNISVLNSYINLISSTSEININSASKLHIDSADSNIDVNNISGECIINSSNSNICIHNSNISNISLNIKKINDNLSLVKLDDDVSISGNVNINVNSGCLFFKNIQVNNLYDFNQILKNKK